MKTKILLKVEVLKKIRAKELELEKLYDELEEIDGGSTTET